MLYAAQYTCKGSESNSIRLHGGNGRKLLYFGGDRFGNSGSTSLGFWFFQNKVTRSSRRDDGRRARG